MMLLLASASPARRRLLEQAGIPHRVQVSGVDEEAISHSDPAQLVQLLAAAKAQAVAEALCAPNREESAREQSAREKSASIEPSAQVTAVLGCDSVLAFDGEVFGKPRDAAEAVARWRRMAGAWGDLHTGHCLLRGPGGSEAMPAQRLTTVTTRVQFAPLRESEIVTYVASGEPLQCAGGFALEGRGGSVVERLDGCYSNVIGLSLPLLRRWLGELD